MKHILISLAAVFTTNQTAVPAPPTACLEQTPFISTSTFSPDPQFFVGTSDDYAYTLLVLGGIVSGEPEPPPPPPPAPRMFASTAIVKKADGPAPFAVPEATPEAEPVPSPAAAAPAQLDAEKIFALINAHRAQMDLPPFEKHPEVCAVAEARRGEIQAEIQTGRLHQGLKKYQGSLRLTENMIHLGSEEAAVSWWFHSPVHRRAIESDYPYSCGACAGRTCAQLFARV